MTRKAIYLALIFLAVSSARPKKEQTFHLVVEGVGAGTMMPVPFTCNIAGVQGAQNISPPLSWSGEPAGTQSFAIIMEDIDFNLPNTPGPWIHWVRWDIPASLHSLEAGRDVGVPGVNSEGNRGYWGPCLNAGDGTRTYVFQMFALDVPSVDLKPGKDHGVLEQAMHKHVLARAEFRVKYGR